MTILLKEIWPIEKWEDYKVHFARWNGDSQPLEVFVRDRTQWQGWQEYRPSKDDFNRPFIFPLLSFIMRRMSGYSAAFSGLWRDTTTDTKSNCWMREVGS